MNRSSFWTTVLMIVLIILGSMTAMALLEEFCR